MVNGLEYICILMDTSGVCCSTFTCGASCVFEKKVKLVGTKRWAVSPVAPGPIRKRALIRHIYVYLSLVLTYVTVVTVGLTSG